MRASSSPNGALQRTAGALATLAATVATATVLAATTITAGAVGALIAPGEARADRSRNDQWHLDRLNASEAMRYASGNGVVVGVIDSGVDATHPDLQGQVLPGADLVTAATDGRIDSVGHGTTVAALIAGRPAGAYGVRGLAPHAKILPVRVLDDQNRYDDATIVANGIRWAVDRGASVINLSLGGPVRSEALARAIAYAAARDVVVVACTGNLAGNLVGVAPDNDEVWYPAREPGVVAVAGLTEGAPTNRRAAAGPARGRAPAAAGGAETLWNGSITGPQTVLAAPAVNLTGAKPGGYWRVQGTSFAAPLVAATAALVRSRWPELDAANVVNRMIRTARDLGKVGRDDRYGFGEIDPVAALTAQVPEVSTNPLTGGEALVPSGGTPFPPDGGGSSPPHLVAATVGSGDRGTATMLTTAAFGGIVLVAIAVAVLRRRPRPPLA